MGDIRHITVQLVTSGDKDFGDTGTDDPVYLGFFGSGGGREFPLFVTNFDDYERGSKVDYFLGNEVINLGGNQKQVDRSSPGQANDPARLPVDLDSVQFVYLRKQNYGLLQPQTTAGPPADEGEDDAWLLETADAFLGDGSNYRHFLTRPEKEGLWFGNEFGQKVYMREVPIRLRPNDVIRRAE